MSGWSARMRVGMGLAALAALALQGLAIERQSLIGDAPYHLLAGEQALRSGQNVVNLEHPPLVKLLAALPLLSQPPLSPPVAVDRALATSRLLFEHPDRVRIARRWGRLVLWLCFGLPLLLACVALGRAVTGRLEAGILLALAMALSLSVLPSLSVIQTDAAAALGFVLVLLAGLRYASVPSSGAALLLGASAGLAMAAKFSGVLSVPTAALALLIGAPRALPRRLTDAAVAGVFAIATLWLPYAVANRSYDPESGQRAIRQYCRGEAMLVGDRMRDLEPTLLAVEARWPVLAQWLTGLIGIAIQDEIGVYTPYAFGRIDSRGWSWYFPALLAVKTPVVLLAATLLGVGAAARRRPRPSRAQWLLPLVTLAVFLSTAIGSSYNLGVRHLMPVMPVLFLPAVAWASQRPWRSAVLVGVLVLEAAALSPLWMSATNTWWLGDANPTRFAFTNGNSDYRQNFIELARVAERRALKPLHVVYPLIDEREIHAYLPDAILVGPEDPPSPGWYALSVRVEQYVPAILAGSAEEIRGHAGLLALARRLIPQWERIAAGEDHGYVAGTFHLYRMDP